MASLNSTGRTSPDSQDLLTFAAPPVFKRVVGPLTLYRFGSSDGKWWYEKSLIDEIRDDFYEVSFGGERVRDPAGVILANPRNGLAVSHEWNKFVWFCMMQLNVGDAVDAWTGTTAWQPAWQSKPDGRLLHGGLTQYLIYDARMIPSRLITKRPVASLWAELSRSRFR